MEFSPYGQREPKNQPHQMILALDSTALNFDDVLTVDLFEIRSNGERRFNDCKIGSNARLWDEKSIQGG